MIRAHKKRRFATTLSPTLRGGVVDFPSLAFLEDDLLFVVVAVVVLFVVLPSILTAPVIAR